MPWCPKCKSEYVEGIKVCADCKTPLVASLDDVKAKEPSAEELENMRAYQMHMQEMQEQQEREAKAMAASRAKAAAQKGAASQAAQADGAAASGEDSEAMMQARERYLQSMGRGSRSAATNVYEDTAKRAEEYKSGAITLIVVGILGFIALAVLSTDLLPVRLYFKSQWIVYLVMGALFLIFVVGGIQSLRSGKKLEAQAAEENNDKKEVLEFLKERVDVAAIDARVIDPEGEDTTESLYFKRTSVLRMLIKQYFPDMDDVYMEHIIDEVYSELFED